MGSFIVFAILAVLYFIPALVAQGKRNATAIFWLNLLAGWTVIGWVGALIWAATKDARPVTQQVAPVVPTVPKLVVAMAARPAMATHTAVSSPVPAPAPVMAATTPVATKPAVVNITDELERLFQLKEKGALTEEEYIVHKAKLLA